MSGFAEAAERLRRCQAGGYQLHGHHAAITERLASWGWHVGTLEVAGVSSRRGLLKAVGRALAFPDWYGVNLDALADCLSDLAEPTALVVPDWPAPSELPGWGGVRAVLTERIEADGAAFAVVLVAD